MTDHTLCCELTTDQIGYLTNSSLPNEFLDGLTISNRLKMEGSRDAFERLRDRLTELLARVGFDKNNAPTPEGKMIEQIIDALYVP